MPDLVEEALRIIRTSSDGILQSALWKELGIDSRKCSRIVRKLMDNGLIEREEVRQKGYMTYRLCATSRPVDPSLLLAGDELVPCIGCDLECIPKECDLLLDWIYQLAIQEVSE
ncbi:MAG: helix-turn-helix transcriptional regulator [Methanoculleaceae archaeon]